MLNIVTDVDFAQLRKDAACYVDKTWFIEEFLKNPALPGNFRVPSKVTLFTRPRRFGKTLFMNMLAKFFDNQKDSKELFSGLQIAKNEKLCHEWMNKYPVIFLSFKDEKNDNFDDAIRSIFTRICKLCNKYKYLLNSERIYDDGKHALEQYMNGNVYEDTIENTLTDALQILINAMTCYYGEKVILLIDEYDTPLVSASKHGYYEKMANFMSMFYSSAMKDNNDLEFGILTGIINISMAGLFSGLNNIECYDITEERYADLLGFTQEEVDSLLTQAGLENKRDLIKKWYNGYNFGDQTDIYNPWSIMLYIKSVQLYPNKIPKTYWVNTSSNELVIELIQKHAEDEAILAKLFALIGGNPIAVKINPKMNCQYRNLEADNLWTLLYLSGYLTKAQAPAVYPEVVYRNKTILVVPNQEIVTIFNGELKAWIAKRLPETERKSLYNALWSQNVRTFEKILNDLLVGSGVRNQKALSYHGMMFGILAMRYKEVTSSGEGGMGFHDIVVVDREKERAAVLELKRATSENELDRYAEKALKQIVERAYDARVRAEGSCRTILHVGIAFCDKKAKVQFKDASA